MLSNYHVALALALALAMIIAIVFTAPTMAAGLDRLKLVMNTAGLFIVVARASGGAVMLAWGLWAGEKELVYLSFLPLVGSSLFYGLLTRRHQTWYGALGFDDSSARWKSFWNETTDLWQLHRG